MADADGESASALGVRKTTYCQAHARVKTTTVGFYALNGNSVLRAVKSLHKERIVEMFEAIREQNPAIMTKIISEDQGTSHTRSVRS